MAEAYLDVTDPKTGPPSGTLIARRIWEAIYEETSLTASAGAQALEVRRQGRHGPGQARRAHGGLPG
ncbi:MAG: hypothetical protein V5A22_00350 [Salinivenus sp.]